VVEHRNYWYDEEHQIASEKKNKAYTKMQQRSYTRTSVGNHPVVRIRPKKMVHRRKKRQYKYNKSSRNRTFNEPKSDQEVL
jgi:hypothetical protein